MADVERLSVTEASRRGVARLVADAAHGTEVVVERHGAPGRRGGRATSSYSELVQLRDDLRDLALVLGRGGRRRRHAARARRRGRRLRPGPPGLVTGDRMARASCSTEPALDDLRRAGPVAAALLLGRLRMLAAGARRRRAAGRRAHRLPACSTRSTAPPAIVYGRRRRRT